MTEPAVIDLTDPDLGDQGNTVKQPVAGSDAAALPPGYTVFEYRIEKMLGGGGFGLTYLAQDINLQLPVALKEYFPGDLASRASDQSVRVRSAEGNAQFNWGLERFLDEARALASFKHPNITRVLRYFKENGTAYIVMEYETGDPLKRWLARQPGFDRSGLLNLVYPLLDGLEAVHRMNFLHRDIKPDNIYIRADNSPVLLDFGAARRVSADREMTNIISPGFAPFEQYHSQGNQGPWTDLYSLGAVMYWMTTGHKPLESAARVQQDSMPKAISAGNPVFGENILRAIDWAMQPDESRRPQSVAEFRTALAAGNEAKTQLQARASTRAAKTDDAVLAFAAGSQSVPQGQRESLRKNVLGTIMFMDLVAFSTFSMDQQVAVKERFNELIHKALKGIEEASRIVIDTGDGAAVCFLGDPEEALQSALLLRGLLMQKYGQILSVRIGLHLGPMRMVFDINHRVNVVGDGINVAQRVMDFAQANQIVASRSYYEVVSRITDTSAGLFNHLGAHLDKHMRSHDIYAVLDPQTTPRMPVPTIHEFENTATFPVQATLTAEMASDIEAELARLIGPLARVLVKKAVPRAIHAQGLREMLSVSIPDAATREAFAKGKNSPASTSTHAPSQPSQLAAHSSASRRADSGAASTPGIHSNHTSSSGSNSTSLSRLALLAKSLREHSGLLPGKTSEKPDKSDKSSHVPGPGSTPKPSSTRPAPAENSHGRSDRSERSDRTSRPLHQDRSQPYSPIFPASRPINSQPTSLVLQNLGAEQLAQLEKALSLYIGPMAKMIIKKEAPRHPTLASLLPALALHIDRVEDRSKFLAAVQKLQPNPR